MSNLIHRFVNRLVRTRNRQQKMYEGNKWTDEPVNESEKYEDTDDKLDFVNEYMNKPLTVTDE